MRKQMLGLVAVMTAFLLAPLQAVALADAGVVLMVKGAVSAKAPDGSTRALDRKSALNVGDAITTGADSGVALRMKDGAVLQLGADTKLDVKAYSFKGAGDAKDEASLSLATGALRQVSGHMEKAAYKLDTGVSTLGIRGTVFDVIKNEDGTVSVMVREGTVTSTAADGTVQTANAGEMLGSQKVRDHEFNYLHGTWHTDPASICLSIAMYFPEDAIEFAKQMAAAFPDQAQAIIDAVKPYLPEDKRAQFEADILVIAANALESTQAGPGDTFTIDTQSSVGTGGGVSP